MLTMGEELKRLKQQLSAHSKEKPASYGSKKAYFLANLDDILELAKNPAITYSQIIEAIARDGVNLSYDYFTQLMYEATAGNRGLPNRKQTSEKAISPPPPVGQVTSDSKATITTAEQISPEKAAFIAENKRIKALNIDSKEKRAMLAKASEDFFKTQSPLDRN